VILDHANVIVF